MESHGAVVFAWVMKYTCLHAPQQASQPSRTAYIESSQNDGSLQFATDSSSQVNHHNESFHVRVSQCRQDDALAAGSGQCGMFTVRVVQARLRQQTRLWLLVQLSPVAACAGEDVMELLPKKPGHLELVALLRDGG